MSEDNTVRCPACGEIIEIDSYSEIGDSVTCCNCDAELEIVDTHPPRLRALKKDKSEENEYSEDLEGENEGFGGEEDSY